MPPLYLCDLGNAEIVLPLARKHGYGIELQRFTVPEILDDPAAELAAHRDRLQRYGGPLALHAPFSDLFPGSRDSLVRETARVRLEQSLAIARALGVTHMVFHHGYIPGATAQDAWLANAARFWRGLFSLAPEDMRFHLENVVERRPQVLIELLEMVGDARLGVCFDVGHAHLFSSLPQVDWIGALGERITYVHLSDNWGENDEHLPLGQGNVPLPGILDALAQHAPGAIVAVEAPARPSLHWLRDNRPRLFQE